MTALTAWEAAARLFDPAAARLAPLDLLCRVDRRTVRTPSLELVSERVAQAMDTPDSRLIVMMAPQEGKSSTVTRAGTMYALRQHNHWRVVVASYADRIARRFGRQVRNDISNHQGRADWDCELRLIPDQRAANEWELTSGGGVYTVGVGGSLTSRPADLMVIDDPLKDRKAADSPTIREDVWDWWESTASSRLSPGASVILVLTRWHHDDLAGRFLSHYPGEWDVLHIPAQADPGLVDPDPLGRPPGEFMISARGRTRAQWEKRKREAGDEWTPLYQGAPAPVGGEVFDVSKLRRWRWNRERTAIVCGDRTWRLDPATRDLWVFATADTASSVRTSADWTVISMWAAALDGSLLLLDVVRDRKPPHQQLDLARPLVDRWDPAYVYVEPSLRSTQFIREATQAGWRIRDLVADVDKLRRAAPAARRVEHGEVWFPGGPDGIEADGPLLDHFVEELKQFPAGRHDDAVDTFSYAARVAWQDFVPPADSAPPPSPSSDPWTTATDVPPGFDPGSAQW